jgi:hypothetical protein
VDISYAFWVTRAMWKKLWTLPSRAAFEAPHHSYYGGEACATKRSTVELQSHVFFPPSYLFFFLEKYASHCKIKKNKEIWVFICWVKWGPHYFNCNIFNLESFINFFFNFIPLHLIFISNLVLIFFINIFFFLSYS